MPSTETARRASLRTRVAVAAAVLAIVVGMIAAGVAALLVKRLELAGEDERLVGAATLMELELETHHDDPHRRVDDEAVEIAPIGLQIALFENGVRAAGARDVPYSEKEGCTTEDGSVPPWRTCAVGGQARRIVVGLQRQSGNRSLGELLLSVGGATLLAAIVGALVSRTLAGWALAPLTALAERIEKITDETPAAADLGEPSGSAEVETLRETIRGLLGRLGTAIERSQGFAASAAHELRTPLATMIAELELASEESPAISSSLVRVRRTLGRLSVLVERLLMVAGGSANALLTEAVAMEDVVREVVFARPEMERARVIVTVDASGTVRGDEALLRIVVDNLLDNALKFSNGGNVAIRVGEENGEVHLDVRDEGPGIDPAMAEHLLLPFTRGHDTTVPGHGLGLSIVAHAVRLHRGDVRFVPREFGAELHVTIPVWAA